MLQGIRQQFLRSDGTVDPAIEREIQKIAEAGGKISVDEARALHKRLMAISVRSRNAAKYTPRPMTATSISRIPMSGRGSANAPRPETGRSTGPTPRPTTAAVATSSRPGTARAGLPMSQRSDFSEAPATTQREAENTELLGKYPDLVLIAYEEVQAEHATQEMKRLHLEKLAAFKRELDEQSSERKLMRSQQQQQQEADKHAVLADVEAAAAAARAAREAALRRKEEARRQLEAELQIQRARKEMSKSSNVREGRAMVEALQEQLRADEERQKQQRLAKLAATQQAIVENEENARRKAELKEKERADEQRALDEYNAMLEAQDRQRALAKQARFARNEVMGELAEKDRQEAARRRAAEEEAVRQYARELERIAVQEEKAERERKARVNADVKSVLDHQLAEKKAKSDHERAEQARQVALLNEDAALSARRREEERAKAKKRAEDYREQLQAQIELRSKVAAVTTNTRAQHMVERVKQVGNVDEIADHVKAIVVAGHARRNAPAQGYVLSDDEEDAHEY